MEIKDKIEYLAINHFKGNNVAFANMLGTNEANIRNYRSGKAVPKLDFILRLNQKLEVSFDWLLKNGNYINEDDVSRSTIYESVEDYNLKSDTKKKIQSIPLYNVPATASLVSVFAGKQNVIDHISIPNLPKCDGALTITGDSMYPLIKSGDIVAYKQQPVEYDAIIWGEMYLLSYVNHGDTYIVAKFLQKSELGTGFIKMVSQNSHHDPKDIKVSSIVALALIKATVRIHSMF